MTHCYAVIIWVLSHQYTLFHAILPCILRNRLQLDGRWKKNDIKVNAQDLLTWVRFRSYNISTDFEWTFFVVVSVLLDFFQTAYYCKHIVSLVLIQKNLFVIHSSPSAWPQTMLDLNCLLPVPVLWLNQKTHPTPSSSIHLQRFLNGPPSAWQGWTSNITLQKKWRERLGKFCITDWWETNWQQQQNAEANLMSARQRDTQIERTAVKVTSQTPFKHRQSHCHPRKPSVSASMTERDWESKVEQV